MKKNSTENNGVVQPTMESQKLEKIWFVQLGQVRRHSRVLYLPLDSNVVNLYHIRKGDEIKYMLLGLKRAPDPDEPLRERSDRQELRTRARQKGEPTSEEEDFSEEE
jgi:hypothetical protein